MGRDGAEWGGVGWDELGWGFDAMRCSCGVVIQRHGLRPTSLCSAGDAFGEDSCPASFSPFTMTEPSSHRQDPAPPRQDAALLGEGIELIGCRRLERAEAVPPCLWSPPPPSPEPSPELLAIILRQPRTGGGRHEYGAEQGWRQLLQLAGRSRGR